MPRTALIVDDDPIIRNLMATLLRRLGVVSEQAVNGEEALALLGKRRSGRCPYSIVLLDLMMPKTSGWDVIAHLGRNQPEMLKHVIVVSAAGDGAIARIDESHGSAVLHKPFGVDELYAAVESCSAAGDCDDGATIDDAVGDVIA